MSARVLRLAVGAALLLVAANCAKRAPPSGGPPDLEPPRLIASHPDSGAASVPRGVGLSLTFSEGMEPRSTADAIALAPPVEIRRFRWSGRTVTAVLAESLRADQTYTLFVGYGARDRHGNPIARGRAVVFTTGGSFPRGVIEGRLEARGFSAGSAYLWCYDAARNHAPDSTAHDFDAIGLVDPDGGFRVPGLRVPAGYRVWVFADLNNNRSFEPATDLLAPVDTLIALTTQAPEIDSLRFLVVNPRAPGHVKGAVLDSLPQHEGNLVVAAVADTDTTRRVLAMANERNEFEFQLEPGAWTLRAFRDVDKNRVWDPARESSSDPLRLRVEPAAEILDRVLVLKPPRESR
ncbi:MAG: hypothetical protein E6K80_10305 [Candidatus Eisenbacteria bacterium]|uniref:SbsA Ig-like domain-containing protein n=1 Tax=Eiseniibacteriota bacterium TaxID=2212470 RepID=A0A538U1T7_UNCEI|nr:MAG: hypothetical protein E6K80_10305 [Candidatus Eisenbacteria bacterium]